MLYDREGYSERRSSGSSTQMLSFGGISVEAHEPQSVGRPEAAPVDSDDLLLPRAARSGRAILYCGLHNRRTSDWNRDYSVGRLDFAQEVLSPDL